MEQIIINNVSKDVLAFSAALLLGAATYNVSNTYYSPASKIETGTIVERSDSVTTIVIHDKL